MEQRMTRREELIARVSPYCVKGDRLSKMMMIAADGVDYPTARSMVKGLDPSTYHCLMILGGHREAEAVQSNAEINAARGMQKRVVFEMIAAGAEFDEICSSTMLGRETVGHYVSMYAKESGIDREELPCVIKLREKRAERDKIRKAANVQKDREESAERKARGRWVRVNLRTARLRMGLTCSQVAEQIGVCGEHYAKIERGEIKLLNEVHVPVLKELLQISEEDLRKQVFMTHEEYRTYLYSRMSWLGG